MKNIIFKLLEYIYYFSLVILFVLYLFPGSLIGYFLYGNLGQQPNLIPNPIGTSINHFIYFSYITILATAIKTRVNNIFTDYKISLARSVCPVVGLALVMRRPIPSVIISCAICRLPICHRDATRSAALSRWRGLSICWKRRARHSLIMARFITIPI